MEPIVSIVMGSDSDLPVMDQAAEILDQFGIPYEMTVVSAHRTPDRMFSFARDAYQRGIRVIIAGAGGAAHLPGMIASLTHLPVIGVPVLSKTMSGIDSLYSIVQMAAGVPVACVAINGARNAGILAAQILGTSDPDMASKVFRYKEAMENQVMENVNKLKGQGRFRDF